MTQYDNTNSGALWKNDRKTGESHPDFTGKIDVGGTEYQLSAWTRRNEDGSFKLLSVKVQPKDAARGQPRRSAPPPRDFDDSLPDF